MVAVRAAGISLAEKDHVIQFVTGLAKIEDRKSILDKDPQALEEVFQAVTKIHHHSLLAHRAHKCSCTCDPGYHDSVWEEKLQLKMLQGAEKVHVYRDGRCIGCGKMGNFLVSCKETKNTPESAETVRKGSCSGGSPENSVELQSERI